MMKRILIPAAFAMLVMACGGETNNENAAPAAAVEEKKADLSSNPDYQKGLALVAKSDCLTCHKVDEASTGPAYRDIAKKYAGADEAAIEDLANKVIKGGSGNWGQIPMTPHPTVSLDDAKQMVKYVLLLNN